MQQTIINTTEQSILKLEQQGWRFRAGNRRLLIKRGEATDETKALMKQVIIPEACEYLTERAKYNIGRCRTMLEFGRGG